MAEKELVSVQSTTMTSKLTYMLLGLLVVFSVTTIILAAITVNLLNTRLKSTSPTDHNEPLSLVQEIKAHDLLTHIEQLQIIADQSAGTRAIGTQGFNGTLAYITDQLTQHTDFLIRHEYFKVPNCVVQGTPQLQSRINNTVSDHLYLTDFAHVLFSPGSQFDSFVRLVSIPNLGCQDSDWISASATDSVALVKRGDCTFPDKSLLAEKYRVKALFIYNDGTAPDRFQVFRNVRSHMNATIPAYFLSYNLGMKFVSAASDPSTNTAVMMRVTVQDADGVGNICADTPTGDKTKTMVIGAHSDGVLDGSGINDNGSGTVATLALALSLARVLGRPSTNYLPYRYRVRFCWWGAEELGLLGSIYHVERASLSSATLDSGRLQDYLLYLNYDMLASPNSNFGILDGFVTPPGTPEQALPGTERISSLFQQWFNAQKLPWSKSGIGGGSDFVPFLTRGIAAGGVNTGANGIKSAAERDEYAARLGIGNGGLANVAYDSCYHQQCDRMQNVNPVAYETAVKSAAYVMEYMGRLNDLEKWLYPTGRVKNAALAGKHPQRHVYNDPTLF